MMVPQDILAADDRFFAALLRADSDALDRLLADDFLLIDVNSGSEVPKALFVPAVGSGQLTFEAIEADGPTRRVRCYGQAAVVTGRTRMRGRYVGEVWTAHSRYTHVFVEEQGSWRMASAQGTPIAAER
jgi:ketosteroid isomerase-like protein